MNKTRLGDPMDECTIWRDAKRRLGRRYTKLIRAGVSPETLDIELKKLESEVVNEV